MKWNSPEWSARGTDMEACAFRLSGLGTRKGGRWFPVRKPKGRTTLSKDSAKQGWMKTNDQKPFHQGFGEGQKNPVRKTLSPPHTNL